MKGYHPLPLHSHRVAGRVAVALHPHDLGLCDFLWEDSSSYSGGRNTVCKAGLESTEPDHSRTAYMPVTIRVLPIPDYVKLYVDLEHLFM